jgi:predicted alpha/beta hydrolase
MHDLAYRREPQHVSITCSDGARLAGQLFEPPGKPRLAIIIHGATAVPCRYYAKFAEWLSSERKAAVLIYDYRDFGASVTGPIQHAKANMAVWGIEDQSAALDYLCARYPELPVEGIGHSMGGLFLAFHRKARMMRRFTAVASGPAHRTRHPLSFTPAVIAFWFVVGPLLTHLLGYLPGRRIGLGSDLPANHCCPAILLRA